MWARIPSPILLFLIEMAIDNDEIAIQKSMSPSQKDVLSDLSSLLDVAPLFSKPIQNEWGQKWRWKISIIFSERQLLYPHLPRWSFHWRTSFSVWWSVFPSTVKWLITASSPPIEIISSPTTRIYLHMTTNAPPPATKAAVVTLINLSDSAFSFSLDFTPRNKVWRRLVLSKLYPVYGAKSCEWKKCMRDETGECSASSLQAHEIWETTSTSTLSLSNERAREREVFDEWKGLSITMPNECFTYTYTHTIFLIFPECTHPTVSVFTTPTLPVQDWLHSTFSPDSLVFLTR